MGRIKSQVTETEKLCYLCGHWKVFAEFEYSKTGKKNLKGMCKSCDPVNNPENTQALFVRIRYGLSMPKLIKLWEVRGRRCYICEDDLPFKEIHVDHCHDSGKVRGLLCKQCNVGVGMFRNSLTLLSRAMLYLASK